VHPPNGKSRFAPFFFFFGCVFYKKKPLFVWGVGGVGVGCFLLGVVTRRLKKEVDETTNVGRE